jgi:hypothetical protein
LDEEEEELLDDVDDTELDVSKEKDMDNRTLGLKPYKASMTAD